MATEAVDLYIASRAGAMDGALELFRAAAASNAGRVAVVSATGILRYSELDALSSQLARYLRSIGVGRGDVVAICLEGSSELIAAMLGAMKAGAAYLPLDPTYPAERLSYILHDSHAWALVTRADLAGTLMIGEWRLVLLDEDIDLIRRQPADDPGIRLQGDDVAYVIYTSGSTGAPKGVCVSHANLAHFIAWQVTDFGFTHRDRFTQTVGPAFDATICEIWPCLSVGASLYIADQETRRSPHLYRDWVISRGITASFVTTPMAEQVIALDWPPGVALHQLHTGGDRLHVYPSRDLPFALINNYGPTECTVACTSGRIEPTDDPQGLPGIGRPISGAEVYILGENMQPVPEGAPGELYVGGAGVSLGYLNRPELTAEHFLPNPFAPGRMYRTGDLARYRPNGELEFLGRLDEQIKIRGYRIEPAEVTTALNRHPSVQSSLVLGREQDGETRMVAYLVPAPGNSPSVRELQEFLAASLPEYMVPATYVRLDALPMTPNGKIDRKVLPAPDAMNTLRDESEAPRTLVEEHLSAILCELLALPSVGVKDNFFLLGGHSLLGTQLIVRVGEAFGVDLPLHAVFGAPTVGELAAQIESLILARIESMSDAEAQELLQ